MKKVIILRGLPGAGKTSYRKTYGDPHSVYSSDDFHIDPVTGRYEYKKERASEGHLWCYINFLEGLMSTREATNLIIVDNTNTAAYEIAPYYQAALALGGEPEVVTIWCSPEQSMRRNIHAVPPATILTMYRNLLNPDEVKPWWKHSIIFPKTDPKL